LAVVVHAEIGSTTLATGRVTLTAPIPKRKHKH
jgi:hypothetical protein